MTYCVSFFSAYLWMVGFPCAWTENELSIELTLVEAKSDKVIFTKDYTAAPRSSCSWLYVIRSDFHYAEMLSELNRQFCQDIQPIVARPK